MIQHRRLHDLSAETTRWWRNTLVAVIAAASAIAATSQTPWALYPAVFLTATAVAICLGHAACFSLLLAKEQARLLNRGVALPFAS